MYTREELGQFNKSNLRLHRKPRQTIIKKMIWKPTGSTRVQKQRSCVKFALVNAQSVRNRTPLLLSDYVTSNNIDIACITETWLTQLDNVDIAVLEGNNYTLSHVIRDNIRGGRKRQFYERSIQTITESKDNNKALYKITDSLIGKDRELVLPNCASDIKLCEDFSNYFTDKLQQMHTQMGNSRPRSSAPGLLRALLPI